MHLVNILLKWFFNFAFWMLTFITIGVLFPSILAGYSSKAVLDHIDLRGLGAYQIFVAQFIACIILILFAWVIMRVAEVNKKNKLSKRPASQNTENAQNVGVNNESESEKKPIKIPAIPSFIKDEWFSAVLNFSNVCLTIAIFIDRSFFIPGFLCFCLTFFIGFYIIENE